MIRLFTKSADGLLREVPPDLAVQLRQTQPCSHVTGLAIDVLWTDEEIAADAASKAARAEKREAKRQAQEVKRQERAAVQADVFAKLATLGIDPEQLKTALS